MKFSIAKLFIAFSFLFTLSSCVFEDFDEPPVRGLPDLVGNITIAELKAQHTLGSDPSLVEGDQPVLEAVVVGNDETGSIFKELYLQDATGGIVIRLDEIGLNGLYPVGTPVVVDLSSLYIGDFSNKYQLTIAEGERVPAVLVRSTVYANGDPINVEPTTLTLEQLEDPETFDRYLSTLIAFDNLQFVSVDAGQPFADVANSEDLNRTFRDCFGNTIVTRTSSFADFAGERTPEGGGRVVALLDVFGTTQQIKLRSLDDLSLEGERCDIMIAGTPISIADLKARHTLGTDPTPITDSVVVMGTIVGNDDTGNIFKELVIQDETGGAIIRVDGLDLFEDYPLGSDVAVALIGLTIGDFANKYQIAAPGGNRIEESDYPARIISTGGTTQITPTLLTIEDLNDDATFLRYQSTLVQFDDVQFAGVDAGVPYADAANTQSLNRTIVDCDGNSIILRTSGFAAFADQTTPALNGTAVAILSAFNDTRQLTLRSPSELDMTGMRCGGGTGGMVIPIADLRAQYTGSNTEIPDETSVRGIVISDFTTGSVNGQNLFLQDGNAGIVIRFDGTHGFPLGTDLEVALGGLEISEFNGLMQVSGVPITSAVSQGIIPLPAPREVTIDDIFADFEDYESTLVKIDPATIAGGPTFGDGVTVSDGTGSIDIFTLFAATFSGETVPLGEGSVTAIVSEFNSPQLIVRDADDVDGEGGSGGDEDEITAGEIRTLFQGGASNVPADRFIEGVVVSDVFAGNFNNQNIILQTGETGIVIRFADPHAFPLGQNVRVSIGGQEISEFNNLLQVAGVPLTNATDLGGGGSVTPRETTLAEIAANGEAWESTVVTVEDLSFDGVTTFPDMNTTIFMTDGTNTIPTFIRTDATFGGQAVPTGPFTATFVVTQFGEDYQATIRNLDDFQ